LNKVIAIGRSYRSSENDLEAIRQQKDQPQLDRIVVWRVRRQLVDREAFFVLFEKGAGGLAGMVPSTILDEKDRAGDLRKQVEQKGLVAVPLKALFGSLVDQATTEELNGAKDFVAFAQAGGGDLRLASSASPGIGQRSPQGKAGFIAKVCDS
jgi:hypothetical protein